MSIRGLRMAGGALAAHRLTMETAAHNVANVRTPGYSRRRTLLAQIPSETQVGGRVPGMGVQVVLIQRMGDRILEAQINVETGALGHEAALADLLTEVESIVAGADGRGLLDPLNAMLDAFSDVAGDPGPGITRQRVVTTADQLCDAFERIMNDLQESMARNDDKLLAGVDRVNELAEEIVSLNKAIGAAGGAGGSPDLEEQRALAVRELAGLCGAVGVVRQSGEMDVLVGGHYLVQSEVIHPFEIVADPDHASFHTISFHGEVPPMGLNGQLSGYLDSRAQGIAYAISDLNDFAVNLADTINSIHSAGYGLDDTTGLDLFVYDPADPAATIRVNDVIADDPDLFAASTEAGQPGNADNAVALEKLRTQPHPPATVTLLESHTNFLTAFGGDIQLARAREDARESVTAALQARYDEAGGVSLDDEALRLAEAEKAYAAAQRVVAIMLDMMDAILATK